MIGLRISPLAQASLDEALGLAVGLGRIGLGPNVFEAQPRAERAEGKRFVAGAVVGHHPLDLDAKAFVVGQSGVAHEYRYMAKERLAKATKLLATNDDDDL